jgi:hypothetical protein
MGTRGVIARPVGEGFEGRYHHWDSYPEGLGQTLFRVRNGHFAGDSEAMLKFLLDDHTGWSTINGANFDSAPGFSESGFVTDGPACYCHGGRHEEGWLVTAANASGAGCEYAYVIDGAQLLVLSSYHEDGSKAIGMFGMGDPDASWRLIGLVDLDGPEPDWEDLPMPEKIPA